MVKREQGIQRPSSRYIDDFIRTRQTLSPRPQQTGPVTEQPPPQLSQTKRRKRRRWPFLAVVLIILIAATSIGVYFLALKPSPLPTLQKDLQASRQSFGLPIYVPDALPKGFSYNHQTPGQNSGVLIYYLSYDKTKKLSISDQVRPTNIDFNDFYNRLLSNKSDVLSNQGKAVVGNAANSTIGSLVTDKVWVLLSTNSGIDNARLTQLLSSLKPLP